MYVSVCQASFGWMVATREKLVMFREASLSGSNQFTMLSSSVEPRIAHPRFRASATKSDKIKQRKQLFINSEHPTRFRILHPQQFKSKTSTINFVSDRKLLHGE